MSKKTNSVKQAVPGFRPGHEPKRVEPVKENAVKVVITEVNIYEVGGKVVIYDTKDKNIARIEAGIVDGVPKVIVEKKDGSRTMSIGLPYTIRTEPIKTVDPKAN